MRAAATRLRRLRESSAPCSCCIQAHAGPSGHSPTRALSHSRSLAPTPAGVGVGTGTATETEEVKYLYTVETGNEMAPLPDREPPVRKFPRGFMWGSATSAYQVEGAYADEGKGLTIWDAFTHSPGKVQTGDTGDVTTCHYYR